MKQYNRQNIANMEQQVKRHTTNSWCILPICQIHFPWKNCHHCV